MSVGKSPAELGQADIRKLLIIYSIPTIVALIASSVYNIIDSVFIGHKVGALAIAAMTITLPLMNIAAAFGAMVGAGGSTLITIKMGQKDDQGAAHVLGNIAVLNVILGVFIMLVGLIFMKPIAILFGASASTWPYVRDFMTVILIGNVGTHLYFGLNNAMRSAGNPRKAMNMTLLTVLFNLILAPIFIFVFEWGIRGAALATVLSQTVSLVLIVRHFLDSRQFLHFQRFAFRLRQSIVKGILSIGISPFLLNICSCLVVILINRQLASYGGDYAIGAYGNVNKILMLFAMVVMGINQGMQPIAGYNFGAKQYGRVTEVLKTAIFFASSVMITAFLVCEFFSHQIMMAFTSDERMIADSAFGLRITVATFPIVGFQMVTSTFFQSIGKAAWAAFLSTTRQMLFLIPMILLLPHLLGQTGIWVSMPVADTLSSIVTAILLIYQFRKFKKMDESSVFHSKS